MSKIWNASWMFLFVILITGATSTSHEEEFISEASGICRLGDSLVVAGDENPNSFWVIEAQTQSSKIVRVENWEWNDMEDLSAVDVHRFFAMTSHSRTKKGKLKPKRQQLLLISKRKAHFKVDHSWSLRDEILSTLEDSVGDTVDLNTAKNASPDEGGLNVEGLAYHNGQLFLGLRSPLTKRGEALLLRIKNAKGLLEGDAPVFGEVIPLPLSKKGIRGLTSHGGSLLIIAGSWDDTNKAFSLYQWRTGSKKVKPFPIPSFETLLCPEALVAEDDGSFIFVQDFEEPGEQETIVRLATQLGH